MPDLNFYSKSQPVSLTALYDIAGVERPQSIPDIVIEDVAGLADAGPTDISFLDNKKYVPALKDTRAGAVILEAQYADRLPEGVAAFVTGTPYRAFALISQYFYPEDPIRPGVHPKASVDATAVVGEGCQIDAGALVGPNAKIGSGCHIGANAVIDKGVEVGAGCRIGAGAYLGYCKIGRNANIHPGVRIGTRGFGFAMDRHGHIDVPQLGRVLIGDNVEIGANTTIDRGMGPDTEIGDNTKIDNLVQIAHNVKIGRGCVIVAMTGIAGSSVLEDYVVCAAQVGVAGHLRIGTGAQIGAKAGVMKDVQPGDRVGGTPAVPIRQWLRERVFINNLMRKKERKDG